MKLSKTFSARFLAALILLIVISSLAVSTAIGAQPSADPSPTSYPVTSPSATPSPSATVNAANIVFGQVVSIAADKTSFVIQKDDLSTVTVKVGTSTRYHVFTLSSSTLSTMGGEMESMMSLWDMPEESYAPGMSEPMGSPAAMDNSMQSATVNDLTVGDLVAISGLTDGNPARQVYIIRFPDNIKFAQGSVSAVASTSIAVAPAKGNTVTLGWDSESRVMLFGSIAVQVGQRILAIYDGSSNLIKMAVVRPAAAPTPSARVTSTPLTSPSITPAVSPSPSAVTSPSASPVTSPSASPSGYSINTMTKTGIGTYLVDGNGRTLYFFMRDTVGVSNVSGTLLQTWPVFYAPTISVPSTLSASDFGSITRSDGSRQTTFRGYPLYYYANDKTPGDTNGQGIGGVWFVVNPANFPPTASTTPTTAASPTITTGPSITPSASATP